jgi:hypothetical protein
MKLKISVLLMVFIALLSPDIKAEPIYPDDDFKITYDINREKKSILKAELYSLGATVIPLVPTYVFYLMEKEPHTDVPNGLQTFSYILTTAGVLIGPRAGHLYLGDRGLTTASLRATATLTGSLSLLSLLAYSYNLNGTYETIGVTGLCISSTVFLGTIIYDFAAIPFKANSYNKNLEKSSSIHLIPGYDFKDNELSLSLTCNF